MKYLFVFPFISFIIFSCNNSENNKSTEVENSTIIPNISYSLIHQYPHDTTAFTEGFIFYKDSLYESTGSPENISNTRSILGPVNLKTGYINKKVEINKKLFGEGIAILNNKLYQLTYQTKKGFIYEINTFKKIGEFNIPSDEGWGLTTDGENLIMTDGTNKIKYLNPQSFKVFRTINVVTDKGPLTNLNEIEWVNNCIYCNVYTTNSIVKIDTKTDKVVGEIDLSEISKREKILFPGSLEMNGIAYNPKTDNFFITGKMWPNIFEIKISH